MAIFLSKFLPLLVYPVGLACLLLAGALITRRRGALTAFAAAALVVLLLAGNRWVAAGLARSLEWQYLPLETVPQAEAIVVLGGGTEPSQYPRSGVEVNAAGDRVLYAAQLYREGRAPRILLSGGSIAWQDGTGSSPAQDMAEIMRQLNVPPEAIWLENLSQNTEENAAFGAAMLKEKGVTRILLVTSAMHMPRAVALFQAQGLEVIPAPVDYTITEQGWANLTSGGWQQWIINCLPTSGNLSLTTNVLKEYFGLLVYRLRGVI